jgi:EAL domain-containing protein (putative c-di-GMP-specific phosphodiesterase class I)
VQINIDDFGTGYSSLAYLQRFPVDTMKIDRSFVSRISHGTENAEIIRTIVTLAHNLKMKVTAEGIETADQLAQLESLHCENAQGYYLSRPLTLNDATDMLRTTVEASAGAACA